MNNELICNGKYFWYVARRNSLYIDKKNIEDCQEYKELLSIEEFYNCRIIYNNFRQRKYKNKERIIKWIYGIKAIKKYNKCKIVFGTLTFNDKILNSTNKDTRRKYVNRFLNDNTIEYIANIDYGKVNNREHYHFLALIDKKIDSKKWNSIINFKKVNIENPKQTINYVLKLNNHTFKESTKNERLINDRKKEIEKIIDLIYKEEYHRFKLLYN